MTIFFKKLNTGLAAVCAFGLAACTPQESAKPEVLVSAPGAPGAESTWSYAGKTGIGTSYEAYATLPSGLVFDDSAATGKVSKVWFSLAKGIVTETMYGLIHEAQLKEMQVLIVGEGFVDQEKTDTKATTTYLHVDGEGRPLSLAYSVVTEDLEGKYRIEKQIVTDPDEQTLFVRLKATSNEPGIKFYLSLNPHMNNTGSMDKARADNKGLYAFEEGEQPVHLALLGSETFVKSSAGFVGASDGLTDLQDNGQMDWQYQDTGASSGNVSLLAELPQASEGEVSIDLAMGFGGSDSASRAAAQASLAKGFEQVLAAYNGEGEHIGWEDYLKNLPALAALQQTATDGGKLLNTTALVLKAQEDKTHAGALIASLSNPWGDVKSAELSQTGYKAVWPRDFYQCAMALLALGDTQTPLVSFEYLKTIQAGPALDGYEGKPGWFLQKTHVDGQVEWVGVQLDQTAMPIMLAWKLWQAGILSDDVITQRYQQMLKPAAEFLADGGAVKIDWNEIDILPMRTQQERWEEQWGYSPSTTAAIIAGLVTAAEIADHAGDEAGRKKYLARADLFSSQVEKFMFTTEGQLSERSNGRYFLRLSQSQNPNDREPLNDNNGRPGLPEDKILDGGFLELVRYGVRAANDPHILDTLAELDDTELEDNLKVKYNFSFEGEEGVFPGWRRYGNDGYGEDVSNGAAYALNGDNTPGQRGRVWPFFTGERAHFELARHGLGARERLRKTYVRGLELFANEGMMLPEQVWDGVGDNSAYHYTRGEGTNGATPLAWTHAEYVKLLRSLSDGQVWDHYQPVAERFAGE